MYLQENRKKACFSNPSCVINQHIANLCSKVLPILPEAGILLNLKGLQGCLKNLGAPVDLVDIMKTKDFFCEVSQGFSLGHWNVASVLLV